MSLFQKSRKLALKPRRRSLLSEKSAMKAFRSPVRQCENKLLNLANQNSRKNRQNDSTNKKVTTLQKSDVTEHDQCQVCVDVASSPFHLSGGKGAASRKLKLF